MSCMEAARQFNTLRPNSCLHFADNIFKCIFLNENTWISIKISLKFVSKALINNTPTFVQIMAWRRPGDKPLSEQMLARFTDIYASLGLNEKRCWSEYQGILAFLCAHCCITVLLEAISITVLWFDTSVEKITQLKTIKERTLTIIYSDNDSCCEDIMSAAQTPSKLTKRLRVIILLEELQSMNMPNSHCLKYCLKSKMATTLSESFRNTRFLQTKKKTNSYGLRSVAYLGARLWTVCNFSDVLEIDLSTQKTCRITEAYWYHIGEGF